MPSRRPTLPPTEQLPALLKASSLRDPPRDVLQRAFALADRLPRTESIGAWVVRVLFDSAREPLPVGVRSLGTAERRLLLEACPPDGSDAARQLDLRLRRERSGSVEVLGQCLPPWEAAAVEVRSGRSRRQAVVDAAGEFLVRGVPARGAAMRLALVVRGRTIVEIDELPLPDAGAPASR